MRWTCECCGGEVQALGVLGSLLHGRCRDCGATLNKHLDALSEHDNDAALKQALGFAVTTCLNCGEGER